MSAQGYLLMRNCYVPTYETIPLTMIPQSFPLPKLPLTDKSAHQTDATYPECQPKRCGNCCFVSPCTLFCNSCANTVCNQCMAVDDTCCISCLSTFPVWTPKASDSNYTRTRSDSNNVKWSDASEHDEKDFKWMSEGKTRSESTVDTPMSHRAQVSWPKERQDMTPHSPSTTGPGTPDSREMRQESRQSSKEETAMPRMMNGHEIHDGEATLMLCNIPCRFEHDDIVDAIQSVGFAGLYEFVYVPQRSRKRSGNMGYAFVHFKSPDTAASFSDTFQNFQFKRTSSTKSCMVKPAHIQGFNGLFAKPDGKARTVRRSMKE